VGHFGVESAFLRRRGRNRQDAATRAPDVAGYDPRMHPLPHAVTALLILDPVERARVGAPGPGSDTPAWRVVARGD